MIIRKGDWDAILPVLLKAFSFDDSDAHIIRFEDDLAWITPQEQGHAEMELVKGEKSDRKPNSGPTIGPRFRKQHVIITVMKEDRSVIFTNAPQPKKKSRKE